MARSVDVPSNVSIFALTSDNVIYVLRPNATTYVRLGRVSAPNGGNLIGIDFRPADRQLYAVSDFGDVITIDLNCNPFGAVTAVSKMSPTFGKLIDSDTNQPLNMSATTDFDVDTDAAARNFLVGEVTRLLFSIDLSQVNPNLALGRTQNIIVKRGQPAATPGANAPLTGGVFDIAMPPRR